MGRYLFRLPDVGEGVAEAEVVAWHVKLGDRVEEDQSLVDVMTDKATVDMTSPVEGVITKLHGDVGEMAAVGSVLIELEVEGAGNADAEAETAAPAPVASPPAANKPVSATPDRPTAKAKAKETEVAASKPQAAFALRAPGDAPLAAPATRKRAHELGIPLQYVPGTGPGGRITPDDLDAFIASGGAAPGAGAGLSPNTETHDVRVVGLRRKIAERMQISKSRIPHFAYVEECDMTELEALRHELNAHRKDGHPKLTLLPFLMRAMVRALPDFPNVNSRFDDEAGVLLVSGEIHIGIAAQTPGGLMVPVVRHAEARDIWDCAAELARVTSAARDGSATRQELSGSTITLTSLGPLGGVAATPVINHPEVAIIGPNKLIERPVVIKGQVTVRTMMNLSSSFDHRIVDGYEAARLIQQIKRLLEHPALIFMD